jgi:hypothetical protein
LDCGHLACRIGPGIAFALVVGGFLVALTQFFPLLHIVVGSLSLYVVSVRGNPPEVSQPYTLHSEVGGFIATALTGLFFVSLALSVGWCLYELFAKPRRFVP